MGNKNLTIDVAKGIAIILVVYGHIIEHSLVPWSGDYFQNPVFKLIYTFHMPLFVFISGYLMAYSLKGRNPKDVFISRCKSLLVPFLTLGLLGTLMTYLLNFIFGKTTGRLDIAGDLANQLLLSPSVWFLFTLFAVSGLLIFSAELEKRFGSSIFFIIYALLMMAPWNDLGTLYYVKWFYVFYLAGYFIHRSGFKISIPTVKMMILFISAIGFGWFLNYWTTNDYIYINKMHLASSPYSEGLFRLLYRYMMGFLGIILSFYLAGFLLKTKLASVFGTIGVYSLDIYIIQMLLVEGIYPRWIYRAGIHLDFNSPWVLYLAAPLMSLFFVILSIFCSKWIIRKNPLLNTLLLGARG